MRRRAKWMLNLAAAIGAGMMFQFVGCSLGGLKNVVTGLNPCGTILFCDPRLYNFVRSGIDGPGLVPEQDPFCTFPPFCSEAVDPIYGGLVIP